MKRSSLGFAFLALTIAVFGCSKKDSSGSQTYLIPWQSESGAYEVQKVEIKSFNEASKLRGEWAKILVAPKMNASGKLEGKTPVGRFIERSDGVKVPADFTTLQATVLYAHYERLHDLDVKMGVASSFLWPATIATKLNYIIAGAPTLNNAFYDSGYNATVVVRYDKDSIPLAINGGVLAHEHFHAIFQDRVLNTLQAMGKKVVDSVSSDEKSAVCRLSDEGDFVSDVKPLAKLNRPATATEFNWFLLRALNEGLADYWGWLYSGDTKFVARSLPEQAGTIRNLDLSNVRYTQSGDYVYAIRSAEYLRDQILDNGMRMEDAYEVGTSFALTLKRLTEAQAADGVLSAEEAKAQVGKAIVKGLATLVKQIAGDLDKNYIEPSSLIKPFFDSVSSLNAASCDIYDGAAGVLTRPDACRIQSLPRTKRQAVPGMIGTPE